jgi:hypothetical protein
MVGDIFIKKRPEISDLLLNMSQLKAYLPNFSNGK